MCRTKEFLTNDLRWRGRFTFAFLRYTNIYNKNIWHKISTGWIITRRQQNRIDETRKGRNIHLMCIDLVKTSLLLCRRSIRGWWLWVSGTVTPRSGTWTPTPPWTRAWWCRWWASCPTTCSPWGSSCRPSCWRRRFVVLPNLLRVRFLVNVWNDVVVCFFFRAPLQTNSTSTTTCFVTRTRCSATLILSPPKVRWFVFLKTVHASTGFTF